MKNGIKKYASSCMLMVRYVYNADKIILFLKLMSVLSSGVVTYIGSMYLKWILDYITLGKEVVNADTKINYIVLVFAIQLISLLFYTIDVFLSRVIIPRREYIIKNKLQNIFINKSMNQDLSNYEDWDFYDTYTKTVRYADTKALEIVNLLFTILNSIVSLIVMFVVVSQLDATVLIIVFFMVVVSSFDQRFSNKYSYEQFESEETINRESEYIKKVAHHKNFAKEVRIFHMAPFLQKKLNDVFIRKYFIFKKANTKYWKLKYCVHLINSVIMTPLLLVYIGFKVLFGTVSIGSFTVLFNSAYSVSGNLSALIMSFDKLGFECKYYVFKLEKMLNLKPSIENSDGLNLEGIDSIEFKNVYFKYPTHSQWVLNDVSFKLEKGENVALVGKNGAGKSTIIKLLLRLYDVSKGEILINGMNIINYDVHSLRRNFSAVLQDYQIMDFTIEDNILLGEKNKLNFIYEALKFVDFEKRIEHCKKGIQTYIGREFDPDGEDFSGGERQKIAIVRGLVRKRDCVLWDEANSSLDPFSEAKINKAMTEKDNNRILVVVTHRLTSAVSASKIIHIENGKLISTGNHFDLLEKDAIYKKMFDLQAALYKAEREIKLYE